MSESYTTLEEKVLREINGALGKTIREALGGYHGPLTKVVNWAVERHQAHLEKLVDQAIAEIIEGPGFAEELRSAMRDKLARTLVSRLGGEMEKRVNELKANPATRARITLALEKLVKEIG